MTLPTVYPKSHLVLKTEPLTPAAFEPFGTVIAAPLTQSLTSFPSQIPTPLHPNHQPRPVPANQSTALKTSPISPLINNYPIATESTPGQNHATSHPPGKGLMSIFSSFPRRNIYLSSTSHNDSAVKSGTSMSTTTLIPRLKLGILERHPYTTQTFCPFNYSSTSTRTTSNPPTSTAKPQCYILIIVSPTLPSPTATPPHPPDLTRLRAFIYPLNDSAHETPNIAITYNAGTWHAPMIVLGNQRVDFLVTQFANGVGGDDCQEVLIGTGPDERVLSGSVRKRRMGRRRDKQEERGREVEVDLEGIGIDIDIDVDEGSHDDSKGGGRTLRTSKL